MLTWILLAILLWYTSIMLPALLLLRKVGFATYLGPRDSLDAPDLLRGRALRAFKNLQESMPVFLVLAVLSMVVPNSDAAQALLGAQIFVLARAVYLPLYVLGVPLLRSVVMPVSLVGLVLMGLALL